MKALLSTTLLFVCTLTTLCQGQHKLDAHDTEAQIKRAIQAHKEGKDDLAMFIIFRRDTSLDTKEIHPKIHEKYAVLKNDLRNLKRKHWKDLNAFMLIYHELQKGNHYAPLAVYELDSNFIDIMVHFKPIYDEVIEKTEEIREKYEPEKQQHHNDYLEHFHKHPKNLSWTGNINDCAVGELSVDNYNTIIEQWKYLRRLAKVYPEVELDDTYNVYAQHAALVMAANDTITPNIEDGWSCSTNEAKTGAKLSIFSIEDNIAHSLLGLLEDSLAYEDGLPYRKKLLSPETDLFGYGAVPLNDTTIVECFYADGTRRNIKDKEIVQNYSFPSEGYFPYPLIPKYWSYTSLHNHIRFNKTIVKITDSQGKTLPVEVVHKGIEGEQRSVVWKFKSSNLNEYIGKVLTVRLSKVLIAGEPTEIIYSVIPFATAE